MRKFKGYCFLVSLSVLFSVIIPHSLSRRFTQMVFSKTRILSVKVATLETFLTMVKTLDQVCWCCFRIWSLLDRFLQTSLTQKLVPLLSKIRTKEPAVTVSRVNLSWFVISLHVSPCFRWQHCLYRKPWVSKWIETRWLLSFSLNCGLCR